MKLETTFIVTVRGTTDSPRFGATIEGDNDLREAAPEVWAQAVLAAALALIRSGASASTKGFEGYVESATRLVGKTFDVRINSIEIKDDE